MSGVAHGDLNGCNILIDAQSCVWLIDFAKSGTRPLFTDMAKVTFKVTSI